jgi:ATP-binding cassette, subfamily C (CFTR/MRP), member 1
MRLLDLSTGTIVIDGVDLATIPREDIRRRLIAITQDQFVLPGTVRQNIDPFGACDDASAVTALERVGIWRAIEEKGGLDKEFEDEMLSHGQRQLFFLARAILRKDAGKVVLLDEATSRYVQKTWHSSPVLDINTRCRSIDRHTESMIQQVIHEDFRSHTVLSIAHRLDTILDFDRVIVLEKGCIVEEGAPRALLNSGLGRFRALWDASRRSNADES